MFGGILRADAACARLHGETWDPSRVLPRPGKARTPKRNTRITLFCCSRNLSESLAPTRIIREPVVGGQAGLSVIATSRPHQDHLALAAFNDGAAVVHPMPATCGNGVMKC